MRPESGCRVATARVPEAGQDHQCIVAQPQHRAGREIEDVDARTGTTSTGGLENVCVALRWTATTRASGNDSSDIVRVSFATTSTGKLRYGPAVTYAVIAQDSIGWVTEAQMVEVDRAMIDDLGISLLQMMENAGRNLARVAIDLLDPSSVWVAAGSGGNGGGGMVAARHLANAAVDVTITTTRPADDLAGVPAHQLGILQHMGVRSADGPVTCDLAVDALVGYSLRSAPRGRTAELTAGFGGGVPSLSLDVPSGVDMPTGETPGAFVTADATMTLARPKSGLRGTAAVGRLLLADISVPRSVTRPPGGAPDFRASPIVEPFATTGGST